jgi:copper chaperone NosL
MRKSSKILIAAVSIALMAVYFLPVWDISLEAPQYPEGLGMKIWLNTIKGDLQIINGLNHYIGMKTIDPDSINELKIMPYLLGVLIILGLTAGLTGKKKLLTIFVIVFIAMGIAGAVDFYIWEYDYGHNLDPEAAIKVPGMSYQPPLIGSKELLNFTAHSYPDIGGMILIAGGIIALITWLLSFPRIRLWRRESKRELQKNSPGKKKNEKELFKNNANSVARYTELMQH